MAHEIVELAEQRVIYRNKTNFDAKLAGFVRAGKDRLQVISDFDFTLSKYFQKDLSRSYSCHMVLERCEGLPSSYQTKAQALQSHYHPIENDMSMGKEEKFEHMAKWANSANDLLREAGLNKSIVDDAVKDAMDKGKFTTRDGLKDLLDTLLRNQIPLLLFSAGVANCLEYAILRSMHPDADHNSLKSMDLRKSFETINVISNRALWDEGGQLVDFSQPVLHVLNKCCTSFLETNPHFQKASDRTKLLIFGDSLGDLKMSQGLDIQEEDIIKVGFLNAKDYNDLLPIYLANGAYDLIILDDPSVSVHLNLLSTIIRA